MNKTKEFVNRNRLILIAGGLGAIVFMLIYGINILNPTYTDWLLNGAGDTIQHYLGWKLYRNGDWTFPIGLTDQLAYPNYTSVIFTDSIPIFAVIFKILSPILPKTFQYFGLWGIMCFILQGAISAKLLRKYLKSNISAIIGSVFFMFPTILVYRMYAHTALAGQWLILLAMASIVYYEDVFAKNKNAVIFYGILGALCASTHVYFIPMIGIILCFFTLVHIKFKRSLKALIPMAVYLISAAFMIFILGGFSSLSNFGDEGLGHYSFNLNGFFNPMGYSQFLKDLKTYTSGQYEGIAYLGLGIIFLLLLTLLNKIITNDKYQKENSLFKDFERNAFIGIIIVSIIVGASYKVSFGQWLLLYIPVPDFLKKIWTIFRASGRMVWPAVYLIYFITICCCCKFAEQFKSIERNYKRFNSTAAILLFCLILQVSDLSGALIGLHERFYVKYEYESLLKDAFWQKTIEEQDIEHFVFRKPASKKLLYSIADLASDFDVSINDFHFARRGDDKIFQEALNNERKSLKEENLYIFNEDEGFAALNFDGFIYQVDDLIVGYKNPLEGEEVSEEARKELATYECVFENNKYLRNGEDKDGKRYLYEGGLSYGPYIDAPKGAYRISVTGNNLEGLIAWCQYSGGLDRLETVALESENNAVSFEIYLTEDILDLEIMLQNVTETQMEIDSVKIEMLGAYM